MNFKKKLPLGNNMLNLLPFLRDARQNMQLYISVLFIYKKRKKYYMHC